MIKALVVSRYDFKTFEIWTNLLDMRLGSKNILQVIIFTFKQTRGLNETKLKE